VSPLDPRGGALPPIPPELGRLSGEVGFRMYGGAWHLLGPADLLPIGERVTVPKWGGTRQRGAGETAEVVVTGYVAERVVRHREGSYTRETTGRESTRFVVATFETDGS